MRFQSEKQINTTHVLSMLQQQLKYLSNLLLAAPFYPLLKYQGKKVRATVPDLLPPTDMEGIVNQGNSIFNLLVLGESTMAGIGVKSHVEGFTGSFAKELAITNQQTVKWKVAAKSGFTASQVEKEILPIVTDRKWDLIVIGLGANNAFVMDSPTKWQREIKNLIGQIRKKWSKTPILFLQMPPIADFPALTPLLRFFLGREVKILGETLAKMVQNFSDVYYIDEIITLKGWLKKYPSYDGLSIDDFFSDGVHPSKLTYQLWAKEAALFWNKIQQTSNVNTTNF